MDSFLYHLLLLACSSLWLHSAASSLHSAASSQHSNSHLESRVGTNENPLLLRRSRSKIFHPSTGLCVVRRLMTDPLELDDCSKSDSWQYTPQKFLMVKGTYFCLEATELGAPVKLAITCQSEWVFKSGWERMHLVTKLADGREVCLDVDSEGVLVSNSCNEFYNGESKYHGVDSQWFKMVTTSTS